MSSKLALPAEVKKRIRSALVPSIAALRQLARYRLEPSLQRRLQVLGERKEFLDKEEHNELLALVAFTQRRTIEKLQARVALERLSELLSDVAVGT